VTAGFGLENLPFGVVQPRGKPPRVAVRFADGAIDLAALQAAGLLDEAPAGVFAAASLNPFLACGPSTWAAVRSRLQELLADPSPMIESARLPLAPADVTCRLPVDIADYADFYSSLEHATNLGHILRPGSEPLLPNWRHVPVGYHGRAGTVVVSGTPVRRPSGVTSGPDGPRFGPSRELDIELEVGWIVGVGNDAGSGAGPGTGPGAGAPIRPDDADAHIFGAVLLNDWSSRDIQAFEYQPLGPFLGKSFATTISAWVVPFDALRPCLRPPPVQTPAPSAYLQARRPWAVDIDLSVELRVPGGDGVTICDTNFASMYWTFAQQLAHLTVNGAIVRTGDLLGSGTVSGSSPGSYGSLIELTARGRDPLVLPDGSTRAFLEDGDTVTLRARAGCVQFGSATGTVVAPR
jgi:fumarylacetoacetase